VSAPADGGGRQPADGVSAVTASAGTRPFLRARAGAREPRLHCRVRLVDGRVFTGPVSAARHRAIQIAMLHAETGGFVELTPGTRPPGGKVQINRRHRREHFLPGGAAGERRWLERLLEHASHILNGAYAPRRSADGPTEEAFLGVTGRTAPGGEREHVSESRWLWVDVDEQERLDGLYAFLAERPCHLLVASGGSTAGMHAYWRLDRPLAATRIDARTGEVSEPIERANLRLIAHLGADRACRDRARLLRLCGSPNHKRGEWARILTADLALTPYSPYELVGDLPDPEPERYAAQRPGAPREVADPYKRIPAAEYMTRLAGRTANRAGYVRCPAPSHPDEHPSCHVGGPNPTMWQCQSCQAAGSIYDLASLILGGPYGRGRLHGEAFKAARKLVIDTFGEL
jgi:hypothetical protein